MTGEKIEHANLATALCAAQDEMENAAFNKTNPHFKNKYADLAAIREASKALRKHGITISQVPDFNSEDGFFLRTILMHGKSEQRLEGRYPLLMMLDKPQAMGSSVTYARRYSWSPMVGIASEEDDDGELATKTKSAYQARNDGDWPSLISEINMQKTTADLRAWGLTNKGRIGELPPNWKEHLRDAFSFRLKELGGNEGPPSKLVEVLEASHAALDAEEDNAEVAAASYLDNLDSMMSGAKDEETITEVWQENGGIAEMLSPADQDKAQVIFEKHLRRAKADAAVKGRFKRPGG